MVGETATVSLFVDNVAVAVNTEVNFETVLFGIAANPRHAPAILLHDTHRDIESVRFAVLERKARHLQAGNKILAVAIRPNGENFRADDRFMRRRIVLACNCRKVAKTRDGGKVIRLALRLTKLPAPDCLVTRYRLA